MGFCLFLFCMCLVGIGRILKGKRKKEDLGLAIVFSTFSGILWISSIYGMYQKPLTASAPVAAPVNSTPDPYLQQYHKDKAYEETYAAKEALNRRDVRGAREHLRQAGANVVNYNEYSK